MVSEDCLAARRWPNCCRHTVKPAIADPYQDFPPIGFWHLSTATKSERAIGPHPTAVGSPKARAIPGAPLILPSDADTAGWQGERLYHGCSNSAAGSAGTSATVCCQSPQFFIRRMGPRRGLGGGRTVTPVRFSMRPVRHGAELIHGSQTRQAGLNRKVVADEGPSKPPGRPRSQTSPTASDENNRAVDCRLPSPIQQVSEEIRV